MSKSYPPTVILRHRKENLKKCSLRGLETRADFQFYRYPGSSLPNLEGYIFLTLDAPPLTSDDKDRGLFLIDATWRYAEVMQRQISQPMICRSIPDHFCTAYPRKNNLCPDPKRGLASVEAITVAYHLLGRECLTPISHRLSEKAEQSVTSSSSSIPLTLSNGQCSRCIENKSDATSCSSFSKIGEKCGSTLLNNYHWKDTFLEKNKLYFNF